MSAVSIEVKKYGQVTQVHVDGKHCYNTAVSPKYAKEHIEKLLNAMDVENYVVKIAE